MNGISTLHDIEQVETAGIPKNWPDNTYQLIKQSAEEYPDALALSFFLTTAEHKRPETWSYRELLARITQTANFFHSLGVGKDDVIAFVLPNLPETHFTIWGGQAAGIVAAINPLLEADAIAELLQAAGAKALVTLAPFPGTDLWTKLQPVLHKIPSLREVVLVNLADRVPGPKRLAAQLLQKREVFRLHGLGGVASALPKSMHVHDFTAGIRRERDDELQSRRIIQTNDYSSYFCTGGTTGTPKIAMRRHGNEVANAWSAGQFLGSGIGVGKNIFCGLPLFHVNGVLVTGLLPFSTGAHVILGTPQGYRGEGVVKRFWEIVEYHQINFFSGVPTLYASLLQVPIHEHRVSSLEFGLCGAAPLPTEVFRNFQDRTGLKILEGYGLTEGTCVSSVNPPFGDRHLGSIGLRIPGQAMKVVMLDEQGNYLRDCAVNEVGVLTISGPNVFAGYKVADHNKGLWINMDDDKRWLNTGDLGRQDGQGYFWLTGRKKELIIRGGHNIDPAIIEEPLHRHPAVQVAAAVGKPDAHAGELPVAYVQLKPGTSATEAELLQFIKEEISERAAIPKHIRLIETMPLTGVGKIFKPTLKLMELESAVRDALQEAKIAVTKVDAMDDKQLGLKVSVALTHPSDESKARTVLGQFSFKSLINNR